MDNPNYPAARQSGLVIQEMPDEVLIYDLDTNKAHCLNQSAAMVWKSCDGTRSVGDIAGGFERAGAGKVTEDFVWLAIDQLNKNNLLLGNAPTRFVGQSRRQVLKTVGLASMIALPIIASLVAPPNALGAVSCSCSTGSDCAGKTQCMSQSICTTGGTCAPS